MGVLRRVLILAAAGALTATAPVPAGVAYFVRDLHDPRDRLEARPDVLDAPVHPGSVLEVAALAAALESGALRADSSHVCRRAAIVNGRPLACAHPDLKRPLSPAEALAYSCHDFFVALAPRLSREALNRVRTAAGLSPVAASTDLAAAMVGLDGPRVTPRALIDTLARLAGVGPDPPVALAAATRAVLVEGLRGAAEFGAGSALGAARLTALAKTGSVTTSQGTSLGLVVAFVPAARPERAIVVVSPGGAGMDAAALAAEILRSRSPGAAPAARGTPVPAPRGVREPPGVPGSTIRLGRTLANGQTRVETLALDDYVAEVLAGEGQARAADAAQQALAITARTFAIANRNRHRAEGFDLCDTTHCQVVRPSTPTTRRAAAETTGRVLLSGGEPAFVFYSAWCGGRSELASEVWPGAIDYAYEPSVVDDACRDEPAWTSEIRAADIERALRTAGLRGTRLRELRVVGRNASGRVSRLRLEGFSPSELGGHEFRMAVGRAIGWQALRSTAFDVERTSTGYRFRGRGYGHGVGLCVVGAGNRAARGASAEEILRFYFPGLTVGSAPPAAPAVPAAPEAPAAPDVRLSLPAAEERERTAVLSLVRQARDAIVQATGARPSGPLTITVHPTVDSFGRATGQSWWASGATAGSRIDLLPIAILRQQGQLERTIRHEIAHALLDGALAARPTWVREGAAAYFANPDPRQTPRPTRVTCPSDAELLRPVSPGAQRDAYARAEACFARAIAAGKKWSDVR